jgi:hypothetical protein
LEPLMTPDDIKAGLTQFDGTAEYYRHWTRQAVIKEGVKFLADACECYWLIDAIVSYQLEPAVAAEEFQVWKLAVVSGHNATLTVDDGNGNVVGRFSIEYTDFPLDHAEVWLQRTSARAPWVLLLPSEY